VRQASQGALAPLSDVVLPRSEDSYFLGRL
jgi:hypothetical protein